MAQARNQQLAREIEAMRARLQSMGMCVGGSGGGLGNAPNTSSATSVAQSPAPARPPGQNKNSLLQFSPQKARREDPSSPVEREKEGPSSPGRRCTQLQSGGESQGSKVQGVGGKAGGAASSAVTPYIENDSTSGGENVSPGGGIASPRVSGASGGWMGGEKQPSLFAKMRKAGAVRAAERADGDVISSARDVYK